MVCLMNNSGNSCLDEVKEDGFKEGKSELCGIFLHFPLSPHTKATRRNKIVEEIMSYKDF